MQKRTTIGLGGTAMKYFSRYPDVLNAECEHCKRVLKIRKELAIPTSTGFELNPPGGIRCICGAVHHNVLGTGEISSWAVSQKTASQQMVCPHCQSRGNVTTRTVKRKKGISGAKVTGLLLTAGLSLFATGLSRKEKETEAHCGACGATWHFS